jgi:hypothetical protein
MRSTFGDNFPEASNFLILYISGEKTNEQLCYNFYSHLQNEKISIDVSIFHLGPLEGLAAFV